MHVQLLTAEGAHVAHVEIPAFDLAPRVLVWGDRTFVHQGDVSQYHECLSYVVVFPGKEPAEVPADDDDAQTERRNAGVTTRTRTPRKPH